MNNYLKDAIKRYNKMKGNQDFFLNPISQYDALIIEELISIVKGFPKLKELSTVLSNYKLHPDKEILQNIKDWHKDLNKKPIGGGNSFADKLTELLEDKEKYQYIKINGNMIPHRYIYGYERKITCDDYTMVAEYWVKLNPLPEDANYSTYYANYKIKFSTEEEMDIFCKFLDNFLAKGKEDNIEKF